MELWDKIQTSDGPKVEGHELESGIVCENGSSVSSSWRALSFPKSVDITTSSLAKDSGTRRGHR